MEPYLDSKEEEYEETIQTKYPLHKYQQNPQKNSVNYSYQNYLKTNKNSPKWKEKINQYKTINFNTQNSKKQYNNYSYSSQNDEPRNSAKYYSHNNKYLIQKQEDMNLLMQQFQLMGYLEGILIIAVFMFLVLLSLGQKLVLKIN